MRQSCHRALISARFPSVSPSPSALTVSRAFRHRGVTRTLVGAWLLAHALFVAAIPVLDARLESGATVVAHWEDGRQSTCPPPHDTSACRLCQLIGSGASDRAPRAEIASAVSLAADRPGRQDERPAGALLLGATSSRAPPIV